MAWGEEGFNKKEDPACHGKAANSLCSRDVPTDSRTVKLADELESILFSNSVAPAFSAASRTQFKVEVDRRPEALHPKFKAVPPCIQFVGSGSCRK